MKILLMNNGYPSDVNPQYSTYIKSIEQCIKSAHVNVDKIVLDTRFKSAIGKLLNYFKFYIRILCFNNYRDYDYIYVNNYPYYFFPLMLRIRSYPNIIIHWHGTEINPPNIKKKILNIFSYQFLPKTHTAIAPSNYFAGQIIKRLGKKKIKNLMVSPSGGVNVELFTPKKSENKGKVLVLGYASSIETSKGIDFVVKLSEELEFINRSSGKKVSISLIEYGAEKQRYSPKLIKNPNVKLCPPFPKDKMYKFYNSIDVLLFPTMAESLGLVGLEAMACGKPVVGTNDFSLQEYIISGKTGELFELGNYDSFKNAVFKAIERLDGYRPRELILEKYSEVVVINQYKKILYNNVI